MRFLGLDVVGGGEDVLLGRLDVLEVARAQELALERVAHLGQVLDGGGVRHVGFVSEKGKKTCCWCLVRSSLVSKKLSW